MHTLGLYPKKIFFKKNNELRAARSGSTTQFVAVFSAKGFEKVLDSIFETLNLESGIKNPQSKWAGLVSIRILCCVWLPAGLQRLAAVLSLMNNPGMWIFTRMVPRSVRE